MAYLYIPESTIQSYISSLVGGLQGEVLKLVQLELKNEVQAFRELSCEQLVQTGRGSKIRTKVEAVDRRIKQIDKAITQIQRLVETLQAPIRPLNILVEVLSNLPIPQSVPPGVGIPISITLTFSRLIQTLRELLKQIDTVCTSILMVLEKFEGIRSKAVQEIQKLELLLSLCEAEMTLQVARVKCNISLETLVELGLFTTKGVSMLMEYKRKVLQGIDVTEDLKWFLDTLGAVPCMKKETKIVFTRESASTLPSTELISYISKQGKKYTIKVVEDKATSGIALQHYAVAVDAVGVVVLQGPRSYSSDLGILVEEIKFALDQLR